MAWATVHDVIQQAAAELALTAGDVGDPFGTTDANVTQLLALLQKTGRAIVNAHDWSHLRREYCNVPTSAASLLPPDFRDMVDQSGWNRDNRLPLGGPASEQTWQYLKARQQGVVFNVVFRPMQGQFFIHPQQQLTTPAYPLISFAYSSSYWVTAAATPLAWAMQQTYRFGDLVTAATSGASYAYPAAPGFLFEVWRCVRPGVGQLRHPTPHTSIGQPPGWNIPEAHGYSGFVPDSPDADISQTGRGYVGDRGVGSPAFNWVGWIADVAGTASIGYTTGDAPTTSADVVCLDPDLVVARLKLEWLKAKGFDFEPALADYREVFEAVVGNDVASPKLNLSGNVQGDVLVGLQSVPITNYGGAV